MCVTVEQMFKSAEVLNFFGTKDKNGVLSIGGKVCSGWPDKFEVAGSRFVSVMRK